MTSGLVNAKADIKLSEKTLVAAHVDGDNGFSFIVASKAMEDAIRRAQTYGIGIVTAKWLEWPPPTSIKLSTLV